MAVEAVTVNVFANDVPDAGLNVGAEHSGVEDDKDIAPIQIVLLVLVTEIHICPDAGVEL